MGGQTCEALYCKPADFRGKIPCQLTAALAATVRAEVARLAGPRYHMVVWVSVER